MSDRLAALSERKAMLRARAESDRTQIATALCDIRDTVMPVARPGSLTTRATKTIRVIGFLTPIIGIARLRRVLRFGKIVLTAYRIGRNWRRRH
jgi:hypothetical protein